jgi:hypothetical protein
MIMSKTALDINTEKWEEIADNRSNWRQELKRGLKKGETRLQQSADEQRTRRETQPESDTC